MGARDGAPTFPLIKLSFSKTRFSNSLEPCVLITQRSAAANYLLPILINPNRIETYTFAIMQAVSFSAKHCAQAVSGSHSLHVGRSLLASHIMQAGREQSSGRICMTGCLIPSKNTHGSVTRFLPSSRILTLRNLDKRKANY